MNFCVTNDVYSITATAETDSFTLRSCANGTLVAERKMPGTITGMTLDGETLFCVVEEKEEEGYRRDTIVQVYTFNMKLEELSHCLEAEQYGYLLLSCMDESSVYTVTWNTGSTAMQDEAGVSRSFDVVVTLSFSRRNLKTCESTKWTLDDIENDNECSETLEKIMSGFVTGINSISVPDGKLLLECDVFEMDRFEKPDDPDFDENNWSDSDYVEWNTTEEKICVDLDAKELSYVIPER